MPSDMVFTAQANGTVLLTGTGLNMEEIYMDPRDYQLLRKSATVLYFNNKNGAYPVPEFVRGNVTTPASGSTDALQAALATMFTVNTSSSMTPNGIVYVSAVYGNDTTGNGSLDLPLATIGAGIALADANTTTDGVQWGVAVLSGDYDEQIVANATNGNPVFITLHEGASVASSTVETVSDAVANVSITLHRGARLYNAATLPVFDVSGGFDVNVTDLGAEVFTTTNSVVADVSNGNFRYDLGTLVRLGGTGEVVNQSGGVVRIDSGAIFQSDGTSSVIVKSGGDMKLSYVRMQGGADYASAPAAEDIQVIDCVSSSAVGANVTPTIGTILVDPAFTL
jgi:hypothetical protein